jgi:hypothetical protein
VGNKKKPKARKARNGSGKAAKKRAESTPAESKPVNPDPAETLFLNGLRVRGEVAKVSPGGKLPLKATHIETENSDGSTTTRRARFKAF